MAQVLEDKPEVLCYVKNQGLGFTIPYTLNGDEKQYYPTSSRASAIRSTGAGRAIRSTAVGQRFGRQPQGGRFGGQP